MAEPTVRARLALAVNAREIADLARSVLGDVATPMVPGELIRNARRVRAQSLALVDRAVIAEIAGGASWEDVARAAGLTVEDARALYGPTWQMWLEDDAEEVRGVGMPGDADAAGTADALDQWWRRHAEPWEAADEPGPVRRLVDGQAASGDR